MLREDEACHYAELLARLGEKELGMYLSVTKGQLTAELAARMGVKELRMYLSVLKRQPTAESVARVGEKGTWHVSKPME